MNHSTFGGTNVIPLREQIPYRLRLVRRPSRDSREDDLPELRDEDGRVLAIVEEIPVDSLH